MNKKAIITVDPETQYEELMLGCSQVIPQDEFKEKLKYSYSTQTPLKIKLGADPSRPDIHLGHTVVLQKLRKFQDFGHQVYFLIGDFTGLIGDPTGKNKTRPQLTEKEVLENAKTYQEQIGKILDLSKIKIVYNSEWLKKLSVLDLITVLAKCTVQNIIRREDFANRLESETPIHMHELIYPILQGYDSYALEADIELGGTDQTFNLLMGRDLQKTLGQKHQQAVMTLPLLEGLDGVKKMSKSADNYISINESSENMFGKIMSISDAMMTKYYQLLSRKTVREIKATLDSIADNSLHPMEAKKQLAQEITSYYFPLEVAQEERTKFEERFSKKQIPDDILVREFKSSQGPLDLIALFKELGFAQSNSDIRRLFKQNAIKLNGAIHKEEILKELIPGEYIFKIGKLKMVKVKVV